MGESQTWWLPSIPALVDMNVLTLGARVIGPEPAFECALAFLAAAFSGEPRHVRRLNKVLGIEADEH